MISLYIHIPFCVGKCHYCGFYSTRYSPSLAEAFLAGLSQEAGGFQARFRDRSFTSVYIGGGTPSVLSSPQLERVMEIITQNFILAEDVEFSVEANPNSLTADHLQCMRERGVNRLSLGVQTFSPELLKVLGRPHTVDQAIQAFALARRAGMSNIGIDLIYGIPGQSAHQWLETVSRSIDLAPEHISAYALSLDEGARFLADAAAGRLVLPDDQHVAALYESGVDLMNKAGYQRYEISNFSLPGRSCRHNLHYWERGEYLGLGPGASSFLQNRRYQNVSDVREYTARLTAGTGAVEAEERLDESQSADEYVMLALRTKRGIDLVRYEKEHGAASRERLEQNARHLERLGLLEGRKGALALTDSGFLLVNEVLTRLVR